MDNHQKSIRLGAAAILCAFVLRLFAGGIPEKLTSFLMKADVQSFLIYLETGRVIRFSPAPEEEPEFAGESPSPVLGTLDIPPLTFSPSDLETVEIKNTSGRSVDLQSLLTSPLSWDLTSGEPGVLILHTHTTESYTKAPGEDYAETSSFRTLDEKYNMLSLGDELASLLEAGGIRVIHDREIYDYPAYNGAYTRARDAMERYLDQYPSIRLVLDIHRDASGEIDNQLSTAISVDGKSCARLMLVMGTDASGLTHPGWEENLALGLKLQVLLEKGAPGITRPLSLRAQRFNQDMSPGTMILEVGAAGDSHDAAMNAMPILAQAILALAQGSE